MTETPPFENPPFQLVVNEDLKLVRNKFKDQQIFKNIVEAVGKDELARAEINEQTSAYLQRLIMSNLRSAFERTGRSKELTKFIFKLVQLKSGAEQIKMIEESVAPEQDFFWESIEFQLRTDLLDDLLKGLQE